MAIQEVGPLVNDQRLRSFSDTLAQDLAQKGSMALSAIESRQIDRHRKKMVFSDVNLSDVAIASFQEANAKALVSEVSLRSQVRNDARWFIQNALWRFFSEFSEIPQDELNLVALLQHWRFGPGASRGTKATHFFEKISERCGTVSDAARPLASLLRQMNPYLSRYDAKWGYRFMSCNVSKLTTVPKNEKTDRTICTEPLWNMALQLAAGTCIEGALRMVGCDIRTQASLNKKLARKGSLDGSLSTIDLKWASDLITPRLIEAIWPESWYRLFMTIRSSSVELPDKSIVALNMMSTMGNGFTFPMMTLTLLSLVYACTPSRPLRVDYERYGVFGDDIVVPSQHFAVVCETLERAGLIVNYDKSFQDGLFRESCGGDYEGGVDITPFYVKSLRNDAEVYVAINSLIAWASKAHKVPYRSIMLLKSYLNTDRPFLVPFWEDPSSGVHSIRVPKRYWLLKNKQKMSKSNLLLVDDDIHLLCALAGSVSQGNGVLNYLTRDSTSWVAKRSRLPKGYLDGSVPREGDTSGRKWQDGLVTIFFDEVIE